MTVVLKLMQVDTPGRSKVVHFLEVFTLWDFKTVSIVCTCMLVETRRKRLLTKMYIIMYSVSPLRRALLAEVWLYCSQTINNSSSLNEGNHDRHSVWISDILSSVDF